MKNMYLTADIKAVGVMCDDSCKQHTGWSFSYYDGKKQITIVIICSSYDTLSMKTDVGSRIIETIKAWMDREFCMGCKIVGFKYLCRKVTDIISKTSYSDCLPPAAMCVFLMAGNRYKLYTIGAGIAIKCHKGRVSVCCKSSGRQRWKKSGMYYVASFGRAKYGDTFIISTGNDIDKVFFWYTSAYIRERYKEVRRGRHTIGCAEILKCVERIYRRRCIVQERTISVICCNSTEKG